MTTRDPLIALLLQSMAGGATRNTFDVYEGLKARGWNVHLIVSNLGVAARYEEELNGFERSDVDFVSMKRAPHVSDVRVYFEIRRILESLNKKTILHAHSTKAGMLGYLLNSRVHASVFSPHAYRGIDPNLSGLSREVIEKVESHYSQSYDRVVVEVPLEYEYAARIGIARDKLRLIPNGINVTEDALEELYGRRQILSPNPTVGFVSRLVYQKNPLLFIEVLNEIIKGGCDAKAIVLGDGPLKDEMVRQAERYGIAERIDWRGEVPAVGVYSEMDVMVHTSLYEAMAYSLIEACGALLPIVATRNPGSEAVMGRCLSGNLSTKHDAAELAAIVLRIVRDNQSRLEQLRVMKAMALRYSTEIMISSLEDEYRRLLFNERSSNSAGTA